MDPVKPDYGGACLSNVVPSLLGEREGAWLPEPVRGTEQRVLLVLDGLGWTALERHRDEMPVMASMEGSAIPTVVPSTTTVALTSLTTGLPPADHGVVGYRMHVGNGVLNVLRWTIPERLPPPTPSHLQPQPPFGGRAVPVVTGAGYAGSGFTDVHLRGTRFCGAFAVSDIVEWVGTLVEDGEPFVYAYYGGLDLVAHMHGLPTPFFTRELAFVDRMVGDLLDRLPSSVAVTVTADHGHVQYGTWIEPKGVSELVAAYTGEARFRSLHAKPGRAAELLSACEEAFGDKAWVLSRRRLFDEGWLGPRAPVPEVASRIGDVVLAAKGDWAFGDPTNPGERKMVSGHGSLTPDEMLVPLLSARGRR